MLIYFISIYLFIGVILTLLFMTYLLSNSRYNYLKLFSMMSVCVNLYLFGYLLEINSSKLNQMLFWNQIEYFGIPFFPSLWLVVTLLYTDNKKLLKWWFIFILFAFPIMIFILRITNSFHHLYYTNYSIQKLYGLSLLVLNKGPVYYIHVIFLISAMFLSTFILFKKYRKTEKKERLKFLILFIASVLPYIGLLLSITPFKESGIDYTALILPISLILIMFAILKLDFLEIKTLARDMMFKNNTDGMIILDNHHKITDYNKVAKEIFHITEHNIQHLILEDILFNEPKLIHLFKTSTSGDFKRIENGKTKHYEINSSVMLTRHGKKVGMLKTIRDITDKKILEEKLQLLATTDELSGLNNRRKFMMDAKKELERAKRYHLRFSVLMMDIDDFKLINDTYGHQAGDEVLKAFGKLIQTQFRKTDISGRIGGEEFSVILPNTEIEEALIAAEKIRKLVDQQNIKHNQNLIKFTISIGISINNDETQTINEIMENADQALYESKNKGKNCISVKNP